VGNFYIGWPEGIFLFLLFFGLIITAQKHGEPRTSYNFPMALVSFMLTLFLLFIGGFFDAENR